MIKIEKLTDNEMNKLRGGEGMTLWIALGISALVVFISGVFEGITNPSHCN